MWRIGFLLKFPDNIIQDNNFFFKVSTECGHAISGASGRDVARRLRDGSIAAAYADRVLVGQRRALGPRHRPRGAVGANIPAYDAQR